MNIIPWIIIPKMVWSSYHKIVWFSSMNWCGPYHSIIHARYCTLPIGCHKKRQCTWSSCGWLMSFEAYNILADIWWKQYTLLFTTVCQRFRNSLRSSQNLAEVGSRLQWPETWIQKILVVSQYCVLYSSNVQCVITYIHTYIYRAKNDISCLSCMQEI